MLGPPPISTLFPTTPFFRSRGSTAYGSADASDANETAAVSLAARGMSPRITLASRAIGERTPADAASAASRAVSSPRSEEQTPELQSQSNLVCRLLLEKKKENHRHQESLRIWVIQHMELTRERNAVEIWTGTCPGLAVTRFQNSRRT